MLGRETVLGCLRWLPRFPMLTKVQLLRLAFRNLKFHRFPLGLYRTPSVRPPIPRCVGETPSLTSRNRSKVCWVCIKMAGARHRFPHKCRESKGCRQLACLQDIRSKPFVLTTLRATCKSLKRHDLLLYITPFVLTTLEVKSSN
jgi:hypothetical protein